MSELTTQLLKLINEGKTINQISQILNLSNKRIYNILTLIRNIGFDFERKYYDDGNIILTPKITEKEDNITNIITTEDKFSAIVISDLHFGSSFERLDAIEKIYNYCLDKGIHNIIICGDLIDGYIGREFKNIEDGSEQIEYFIKKYPFDKNILNFVVLGDHDKSVLKTIGRDLSIVLENYRYDLVVLGYDVGYIGIRDDKIIVQHRFQKDMFTDINKGIILIGHSHNSSIRQRNNLNFVNVPSLSNLNFSRFSNEKIETPLAYSMEITFNNEKFSSVLFRYLMVLDKVYSLSEVSLDLSKTLLNPRPDLQPPLYEPPVSKNKASLGNIKKKKHKWE